MGRASRRRKEQRENPMTAASKKVLKDLIRESSPDVFATEQDGKIKSVYYNPLKRILKGETYKTEEGAAVTKEMVKQYEEFLKQRLNLEKIAKANNVDINRKEE